jgi:glyoxylase-like metal-dependent hydrolase (beta-lactamase superfamily II)
MRAIDVRHKSREKVICCWEVDGVLIDPGPGITVETLLGALDGAQPRALLLTHIHFDHAGATGTLVRRWPGIPVYVHERGAPHMVNPEKLVASAGRLYGGEEGLRALWGEMVPVPEENLRILKGGETVEDAFRVEYAPGHASHHVAYFHEPSRTAFVGDVGGARIPPHEFTVAPTPPPDIDIAAWKDSVAKIRAWQPERIAMTHFGDAGPEQLDRVLEALDAQVALEGEHDEDGFVAEMDKRIRAGVEEDADAMIQATPLDQLHMGLARWRSKFEVG